MDSQTSSTCVVETEFCVVSQDHLTACMTRDEVWSKVENAVGQGLKQLFYRIEVVSHAIELVAPRRGIFPGALTHYLPQLGPQATIDFFKSEYRWNVRLVLHAHMPESELEPGASFDLELAIEDICTHRLLSAFGPVTFNYVRVSYASIEYAYVAAVRLLLGKIDN